MSSPVVHTFSDAHKFLNLCKSTSEHREMLGGHDHEIFCLLDFETIYRYLTRIHKLEDIGLTPGS